MRLVNLGRQLLWQLLHAINNHLLTPSTTISHRHLAQRIPSLVPFPAQSRNHSDGRIVLI